MSSKHPKFTQRPLILQQEQIQAQLYSNSDSFETNNHTFHKNGISSSLSNAHVYQNTNSLDFIHEVKTPSWASTYNLKPIIDQSQTDISSRKSMALSNLTTSSSQKINRISNISRLDQLLSKNQLIYQNMRNQLQEISKSNQNIRNNIKNIKPYSQSHNQQSLQEKGYQPIQKHSFTQKQTSSQYKQAFTFTQYKNSKSQSKQQQNKPNNKSTEFKKQSNTIYLQNTRIKPQINNQQKQKFVQQKQNFNNSITKLQQDLNIPFYQNLSPGLNQTEKYQNKKQLQKISRLSHVISSYRQPDSSPIAEQSQNFVENLIKLNPHKNKISETKSGTNSKTSNDKYQIFDNDSKQLQKSIKKQKQREQLNIRKQINKQHKINQQQLNIASSTVNKNINNGIKQSLQTYSQQEQQQLNYIQQPPPISLTFIPFNKLYSSPILQLINRKQLILARKSKTQLTNSNTTNRIVGGIKYKNINLVHDQIQLYQIVVLHCRKIQQILRNNIQLLDKFVKNHGDDTQKNYKEDIQQIKNSVDIGIIGGQNTLKKKLHFSIVAHIYADIMQYISTYLQSNPIQSTQNSNTFTTNQNKYPSIIIGISHQEQQSLGDPYIIKYQGHIGLNQVENSIVYANVKAAIEEIYTCMKMKLGNGEDVNSAEQIIINNNAYGHHNNIQVTNKNNQLRNHRIRVTKLYVKSDPIILHEQNQSNTFQSQNIQNSHSERMIYSSKIISTNKISQQLIQSLELDSVIWCINPMYKYYEDTKQCLDCCNEYKNYLSNQQKKQR